jgi:hypothetical protein
VSIKIVIKSNGQLVAAPASPLTQLNSPVQLPAAKSQRPARGEIGRYRLHVVATNVADVVRSVGGLIFDRAMAGWDVTVEVERNVGRDADRPIRILGGRVATRVAGPEGAGCAPRPHLLAVATDVFVSNEPVRRRVLAARNGNATDVLLWGRRHPPALNCRLMPVRHLPSAAAQVFKSHALAARGGSITEPAEEGFYSMT